MGRTPPSHSGPARLTLFSLLLLNLSKKVRTGVSNPSLHGLHTSAVTNRDNVPLWLGGSFIIPQIKNVNLFCVFFLFGRFFFYFSLFFYFVNLFRFIKHLFWTIFKSVNFFKIQWKFWNSMNFLKREQLLRTWTKIYILWSIFKYTLNIFFGVRWTIFNYSANIHWNNLKHIYTFFYIRWTNFIHWTFL